jgi:hypothetical protein
MKPLPRCAHQTQFTDNDLRKAPLQRKIRLVSSENPDFLQACRLRTRLFIGDGGGRRPIADHITNAKVYFQQNAARNKPNTYVVE